MKIHPSAYVSPQAELGINVEIGPFCVVEPEVQIAEGCRLLANVNVHSGTTIGSGTTVYEGSVLGGMPQHTQMPQYPGKVVIGSRNILREHVTIHRAMDEGAATRIGDDCLLMVGAHVAHDCQLGNRVILTNGVMLGGHVEVGNRACLGGNAAVHQYCRVGRMAMVGGCTKVVQDVPPFLLTDGTKAMVVGLNRVGIRRSGFDRNEVLDLKAAYRIIYREGLSFDATIAALQERFASGVASEFAVFFQSSTRGFVQERRNPPRVELRIHPEVNDDDIEELSRMAS